MRKDPALWISPDLRLRGLTIAAARSLPALPRTHAAPAGRADCCQLYKIACVLREARAARDCASPLTTHTLISHALVVLACPLEHKAPSAT